MSRVSFPRVLHIGFNPIGSPTNTGLTLAAMFDNWPLDRLFELYTVSRQEHQPRENALIASPWVAPLDAIGRGLLGSRIPGTVPDGMNNSIRNRHISLPLRYRLRAAAATVNEIGPVSPRGAWLRPVEEFQPMVIHSLLGGVRITKLVAALAERFDLPVVPHFMDDWPANLFADGQVLGLPRREAERSLRRVLQRSPIALTIGEDMRREFEDRFQLPCQVVGNSTNFEDQSDVLPSDRSDGAPTLTYAGGLHLGRDRILAEVAEALQRVTRASARLAVHTGPSDAARLDALVTESPDVVVRGDFLTPDQVAPTLARSHALVFIESDLPDVLSFTRLSVSTKVPEYLAARRPVLVVGPSTQSSVRALVSSGASVHAAPGDTPAIDIAVSGTLRRIDLPLPPIPANLVKTFSRTETQGRLRASLEYAAGTGSLP